MTDILSSVRATFGRIVFAWIGPSALFIVVWRLLLPAELEIADATIFVLDSAPFQELLLLAVIAILLGFALYIASVPLTRTLEGYYVKPERLRRSLIKRQLDSWENVWKKLEGPEAYDPEFRERRREKLNRYPRRAGHFLPFQLGNILRAGETYGWEQYGISVPDLWIHLLSSVDPTLRETLHQARSQLDLCIASIWLSIGSFLVTIVLFVWDPSWIYAVSAPIFLVLARLLYGRALDAADWYAKGLWGLVDTARSSLASRLRLELPARVSDEAELWRAVTNWIIWGHGWSNTDEWEATIDRHLRKT